MFLYVALNLLDGERGLISYYEKQKTIEQLFQEEKSLVMQLDLVEKKEQVINQYYRYRLFRNLIQKKIYGWKIKRAYL